MVGLFFNQIQLFLSHLRHKSTKPTHYLRQWCSNVPGFFTFFIHWIGRGILGFSTLHLWNQNHTATKLQLQWLYGGQIDQFQDIPHHLPRVHITLTCCKISQRAWKKYTVFNSDTLSPGTLVTKSFLLTNQFTQHNGQNFMPHSTKFWNHMSSLPCYKDWYIYA